jgi:cytochrome c oxidase cbb3-type subunit III
MSARDNDPNRDRLLDHEADGIREFDNALPRWWLYGFYLTIVFAAVYVVNYHVLASPLFGRPGMVAEYEAEVEAAPRVAAAPASGPAVALVALRDEPSLAQGRSIFEGPDNVCSSCHRADLGGTIGPNLTDEYWLHGCSVQQIVTSIRTGFPMKGMMPFGTGKPLTDTQVLQLASYVMARRGSSPADPKPIDPERDVACR